MSAYFVQRESILRSHSMVVIAVEKMPLDSRHGF